MVTEKSTPGRTMDAAWRQAISEGMKNSPLIDKLAAAKDGLIATAAELNQKAIGVRDNALKGVKGLNNKAIGIRDKVGDTLTKAAVKITEPIAKTTNTSITHEGIKKTVKEGSVVKKVRELNNKAIDIRDNAVKNIKSKIKTFNSNGIDIRDRARESIRSTAANAVKRMPDMSNGGKGQQFNVPKPGESIADAQRRLDASRVSVKSAVDPKIREQKIRDADDSIKEAEKIISEMSKPVNRSEPLVSKLAEKGNKVLDRTLYTSMVAGGVAGGLGLVGGATSIPAGAAGVIGGLAGAGMRDIKNTSMFDKQQATRDKILESAKRTLADKKKLRASL